MTGTNEGSRECLRGGSTELIPLYVINGERIKMINLVLNYLVGSIQSTGPLKVETGRVIVRQMSQRQERGKILKAEKDYVFGFEDIENMDSQ